MLVENCVARTGRPYIIPRSRAKAHFLAIDMAWLAEKFLMCELGIDLIQISELSRRMYMSNTLPISYTEEIHLNPAGANRLIA
jgi:hypothetical protein